MATKYVITRGAVGNHVEGMEVAETDFPATTDFGRLLDLGVVAKHGSRAHRRWAEERGIPFAEQDEPDVLDALRTDSPPTIPAEGIATVEEAQNLAQGLTPEGKRPGTRGK